MKNKDKLLGAGIGLAALAAAGTYFLAGRRGAKNRERLAAWTASLEEEIAGRMRAMKAFDRSAYDEMVEETVARLGRAQRVSADELERIAADLKSGWKNVVRELKRPA